MNGNIFDIQRFCIHDGPGIRTVVFMKGCNLRCKWCHNPESQHVCPELMFFADKCTGCGKCRSFCEKAFTHNCVRCGQCAKVCPSGARTITGRFADAEEVFNTVMKDREYYVTSGGGVTVSGGEPLLQPNFVGEFFTICQENGLHTAMETAGNVPWNVIEKLLPLTDLFLYDIKGINSDRHKENIGVPNHLILENARRLMNSGKDILFRMPVIPGLNSDEIPDVVKFTEGFPLETLPYHDMGKSKYDALGREYSLPDLVSLSKDELKAMPGAASCIID